ncbi:MAG TPA: hypothetical protein VNS81_04555 [Nocardioides sp.]|nr:hypothetical protein [Nocardioides sp.]
MPPSFYIAPFSIAGAAILLAFAVWVHGLIRSLRSSPSHALPWDGNWDELMGEAR